MPGTNFTHAPLASEEALMAQALQTQQVQNQTLAHQIQLGQQSIALEEQRAAFIQRDQDAVAKDQLRAVTIDQLNQIDSVGDPDAYAKLQDLSTRVPPEMWEDAGLAKTFGASMQVATGAHGARVKQVTDARAQAVEGINAFTKDDPVGKAEAMWALSNGVPHEEIQAGLGNRRNEQADAKYLNAVQSNPAAAMKFGFRAGAEAPIIPLDDILNKKYGGPARNPFEQIRRKEQLLEEFNTESSLSKKVKAADLVRGKDAQMSVRKAVQKSRAENDQVVNEITNNVNSGALRGLDSGVLDALQEGLKLEPSDNFQITMDLMKRPEFRSAFMEALNTEGMKGGEPKGPAEANGLAFIAGMNKADLLPVGMEDLIDSPVLAPLMDYIDAKQNNSTLEDTGDF
jgi:hypothetical protein